MTTVEFYEWDFKGSLFPLTTNLLMIRHHSAAIAEYISKCVLSDEFPGDSFLSQYRTYATKPRGHLRRTLKLDPVAEFFLYDLVYRNRSIFRPAVSNERFSYGYGFVDGTPIPVHTAFYE